ncbi:MAG: aryl-sulfate sulfotransferase, partial [Flavobacteriales bacterium]|nr:aryl-sulfate sulfotransferase [Flavobacteriales bacterium]
MKSPRLFVTAFALSVLALASSAQQNTVGVLLQTESSYDGYTLMPVSASSNTYLLNNCGEVVNTWASQYKAGMMAYLLPDGGLMRAGKTNNVMFGAGGSGGIIEKFDWNGNLEWSYLISSQNQCQHHDIAVLPNGNVLALVWKAYPAEEWIARGRNPELTTDVVWGTCVVEVMPDGATGGQVVWKWEAINHVMQDFDPELPNYGIPSDYPRQLNVNYQASPNDP